MSNINQTSIELIAYKRMITIDAINKLTNIASIFCKEQITFLNLHSKSEIVYPIVQVCQPIFRVV